MQIPKRKTLSPFNIRFLLSAIMGIPIGYYGYGVVMYFGPLILLAMLHLFLRHSHPNKRAIILGLLVGIACTFFITYKLIGWYE